MIDATFWFDTLPTRISKYPIARLKSPQKVLTVGDEGPLPAGVANGVGKTSPETP